MTLLDERAISVRGSASPLGFEAVTPEHAVTVGGRTVMMRAGAAERYLTVNGERAYGMGTDCETCRFLFERLPGAAKPAAPEALSALLRAGLSRLNDGAMDAAGALMPDGRYRAYLMRLTPRRVEPGSEEDYFTGEQTVLWGERHTPRPGTPYYRVPGTPAMAAARVHAFVVPMTHPDEIGDRPAVAEYARLLQEGAEPTALAISTLDAKWPAFRDGAGQGDADLCFTHFLLDGHHKTAAAASTGRALTLLAFLALDHCVAAPERVEAAVAAMGGLGAVQP